MKSHTSLSYSEVWLNLLYAQQGSMRAGWGVVTRWRVRKTSGSELLAVIPYLV